jgi:hypothetical protein
MGAVSLGRRAGELRRWFTGILDGAHRRLWADVGWLGGKSRRRE